MRFWLIDIPALIVTAWSRVTVVFICLASLATYAVLTALLVLWFGFGIRWGW